MTEAGNIKITELLSDRAGVFSPKEKEDTSKLEDKLKAWKTWARNHLGVQSFLHSAPYRHQSNGKVERQCLQLARDLRVQLARSPLKLHHWTAAVRQSDYVRARLRNLSNPHGLPPWQLLTGEVTDFTTLTVKRLLIPFGAPGVHFIPSERLSGQGKLRDEGERCFFLYAEDYAKGNIAVLVENKVKIVWGRDCDFNVYETHS